MKLVVIIIQIGMVLIRKKISIVVFIWNQKIDVREHPNLTVFIYMY